MTRGVEHPERNSGGSYPIALAVGVGVVQRTGGDGLGHRKLRLVDIYGARKQLRQFANATHMVKMPVGQKNGISSQPLCL